MRIDQVPISSDEDLDTTIDAFAARGGDVLYPVQDAVTLRYQVQFALAARQRKIATPCVRADWVEHGCLMSYGANRPALYIQAGTCIDRILRGTEPGDLPIERPSAYDLPINTQTLRALGLSVPQNAMPLVAAWVQ